MSKVPSIQPPTIPLSTQTMVCQQAENGLCEPGGRPEGKGTAAAVCLDAHGGRQGADRPCCGAGDLRRAPLGHAQSG